jgi:hypothetical protein
MTFNFLLVVLLTSFLHRGYSLAIADIKINGSSCSKSLAASNGFFCQPDAMWMMHRVIVQTMYQANIRGMPNRLRNVSSSYYPSNWHPEVHCPNMMRFGHMDDPMYVCDGVNLFGDAARVNTTSPSSIKFWSGSTEPDSTTTGSVADPCLVYVFGHSNEWQFAVDLLEQNPQCEVHVFTLATATHLPPPNRKIYHHNFTLQLKNKEDETKLSLASIKKKLGHNGEPIAVMKFYLHGAEFPVLFNLLASEDGKKTLGQVRVLLLESFFSTKNNFKLLSRYYPAIQRTPGFELCNSCSYANQLMVQLHSLGFAIYTKNPNLSVGWSNSMHWGLVKLHDDTFKGVTDTGIDSSAAGI